MIDFSIHEIRGSGHSQYEIRRELTQDELQAICKYASAQQIPFADALQAYLDEVQELVDAEVKRILENDILFGVADLKEEKKHLIMFQQSLDLLVFLVRQK